MLRNISLSTISGKLSPKNQNSMQIKERLSTRSQASLFQSDINKSRSTFIQQEKMNNYDIICSKHKLCIVERICVHPNCQKKDILFCGECLQEDHLRDHQNEIMLYSDFIEFCKEKGQMNRALKKPNQNDYSKEDIPFIMNKDNQIQTYKDHLIKQEKIIDDDFNKLIQSITNDIEQAKNLIKKKLRQKLEQFINDYEKLNETIKDFNENKYQNQKFQNQFDDFLVNMQQISQKQRKSYMNDLLHQDQDDYQINMKKLVQQVLASVHKPRSSSNASKLNISQLGNSMIKSVKSASFYQQNHGSPEIRKISFQKNIFIEDDNINDSKSFSKEISPKNSFNKKILSRELSLKNLNMSELNKIHQNQESKSVQQLLNNLRENFSNMPIYRNQGEAKAVFRNVLEQVHRHCLQVQEMANYFILSADPIPYISNSTEQSIQNFITTNNINDYTTSYMNKSILFAKVIK